MKVHCRKIKELAHTNDKARQHTIDLMQSEIEMQCWILLRYLLTQKRIALIFVVENYHGMTTCRYWCFNYLNVPTLKEKQYINPHDNSAVLLCWRANWSILEKFDLKDNWITYINETIVVMSFSSPNYLSICPAKQQYRSYCEGIFYQFSFTVKKVIKPTIFHMQRKLMLLLKYSLWV